MTNLDVNLPIGEGSSARSEAVARVGKRVAVLYEPGRTGAAALDLARRLVGPAGLGLTVLSVAPQDTRICCGAGSAMDYNRAMCETAEAELREARKELGPMAERASFKVLVQDKDPPLAAWIAAGGFDVVLLPARRRPLRRVKHPAAEPLRRATSAEVRIIDGRSGLDGSGIEILAAPPGGSNRR
jgi:hypothetical protein